MKKNQTWEDEKEYIPDTVKSGHKYKRRRKTIDGYPIEPHPFTYEEIQAYQSTKRIVCLQCGNEFDTLAKHIVYVHDITVAEYKEMYGLPNKRGLSSPTALQNYALAARKRENPEFHDPIKREANRRKGVVTSQKQTMRPFRAELSRAHLKKARHE